MSRLYIDFGFKLGVLGGVSREMIHFWMDLDIRGELEFILVSAQLLQLRAEDLLSRYRENVQELELFRATRFD